MVINPELLWKMEHMFSVKDGEPTELYTGLMRVGGAFFMICAIVMCLYSFFGNESTYNSDKGEENTMENNYTSIPMSETKEIFETEGDYVILDVRTLDEYDEGHIPDAICIPNETIESTVTEELPDKEQMIYVYCRSGNRSKQAATKLVGLGYTNIVEIGGIIDWKGEIEK